MAKENFKILFIGNNDSADYISSMIKSDYINQGEKLKNNDFRTITSENEYKAFKFSKYTPEHVFVVPELMWTKNTVCEGYTIAHDLITQQLKDSFFKLFFISLLPHNALKEVMKNENKAKLMVMNFPHLEMLDEKQNIDFNSYSEIHFNLIKHLILTDKNRFNMLQHNYNHLLADVLNCKRDIPETLTEKLTELAEDLMAFQLFTDTHINAIETEIKAAKDNKGILKICKTLTETMNQIKIRLAAKENDKDNGKDGDTQERKSAYSVLFIEDDPDFRKACTEVFTDKFKEINPKPDDTIELKPQYNLKLKSKTEPFNIEDAREYIKTQAKYYDVFFLDLLYKNKNGTLLPFNGLDLYKLIKKYNYYAVIRIVTSLPRQEVGKLIKPDSALKIELPQVFTKNGGKEALKNSIIDRYEEIIDDCQKMEEAKAIAKAFPENSIFKADGIPSAMITLFEDGTYKNEYRKITDSFFESYKKNQLKTSKTGWNGKLFKNNTKQNASENDLKKHLPNIMTFRMIAIDEALKNDYYKVYYNEFDSILKKISIFSARKDFFYKIGFNGTDNKREGFFKIDFIRLFPEEVAYISECFAKKTTAADKTLKKYNENLYKFFEDILSDGCVKNNWHILNLNYNPYEKTKVFETFLTYEHLTTFLKFFIEKFFTDDNVIKEIRKKVTIKEQQHPSVRRDNVINLLLRNIY